MSTPITLDDVRAARERLAPYLTPTPLRQHPPLDAAVPGLTLAEITDAGAQRISVGGALTWVAVKALADAATAIRDDGDLSALAARVPLDTWLA